MIEVTVKNNAVHIPIWVQPRAKRDRIVGEHDGCLKIAVTAPAEGGRANRALVRLLSDQLGISKSAIEIASGATSRRKRIAVTGVALDRAREFCVKFGKR